MPLGEPGKQVRRVLNWVKENKALFSNWVKENKVFSVLFSGAGVAVLTELLHMCQHQGPPSTPPLPRPLPPITLQQPSPTVTLQPEASIRNLEQRLREHPGFPDWNTYNELRHLYSIKNPPDLRKSMEYSDLILRHWPMHNYILQNLSDWQLDKDNSVAKANLSARAQSFPDLRFIAAACFIKIGDLYSAEGDLSRAQSFYLKVAKDNTPDMGQYRAIAEEKLRELAR